MSASEHVGAVVLAGGDSRRMGGGDKTAADVVGETLLRRVLAGLPHDATTVVVGAPGDLPPGVLSTREDPPGGGPGAAALAGWRLLRDQPGGPPDVVLVLAGDAPFTAPVLPRLLAAVVPLAPEPAAAAATDPGGVLQPLLAAFTTAALDAAARRDAPGRSARSLLDGLTVVTVAVTAEEAADVDTPADLADVRARVAGAPRRADGDDDGEG